MELFRTALPAALALLVLAQPPSPARAKPPEPPGNAVEPADLVRICEAFFDSPYEYMFGAAVEPLRLGARDYGMLEAGIGGILRYGSLPGAIARVTRLPYSGFGDLTAIEKLSGLPLYRKQATDWRRDFSHANPDIIRWGARNLLPDPEAPILGVAARVVYERIFSRFFRLMVESHLHLGKPGLLRKEAAEYRKAMKRPDFDGLEWLTKRYAGVLPGYASTVDEMTAFGPAEAIGFWLRRHMDGTEGELLAALGQLMERYDASWFAEMKGARPKGP